MIESKAMEERARLRAERKAAIDDRKRKLEEEKLVRNICLYKVIMSRFVLSIFAVFIGQVKTRTRT